MSIVCPTEERHQVFLNYRGEELRNSFMSHLIDAFERNEINFIVDKYELRGKDLNNLFLRIQDSRIALAIFSPRYAESSWCMDELVKMKKLVNRGKLQVIPIFYKVKARDVRNQTGEFGVNFSTLARASTYDRIKKWKKALECITNKMGLSSKDYSSEAEFVKKIVKEVARVIEAIRLEKEESHFGTRDCNCLCEPSHFKKSKSKSFFWSCIMFLNLFYLLVYLFVFYVFVMYSQRVPIPIVKVTLEIY